MRFIAPKRGLWVIRVYPENIINGSYNMWLPMAQLTNGHVYFLRSNPEITLTSPSNAKQVITVGGYNAANQSMFADSGRGYTISGEIKPDFAAPAVNVYGPGLRGRLHPVYGNERGGGSDNRGGCAEIDAVGAGGVKQLASLQCRY